MREDKPRVGSALSPALLTGARLETALFVGDQTFAGHKFLPERVLTYENLNLLRLNLQLLMFIYLHLQSTRYGATNVHARTQNLEYLPVCKARFLVDSQERV